MIPGTRRILADHYFKRYFDLGMGFNAEFPGETLHSFSALRDITVASLSPNSNIPYCLRVADKILAFASNVPIYALESLSEPDEEYRVVVNDMGYTCAGSRYDLSPVSLRQSQHPLRVLDIPAATPSECRKCYEHGIYLWMNRTGVLSLAEAFEAIRRGKANLPS
jgi:hypothetical protein